MDRNTSKEAIRFYPYSSTSWNYRTSSVLKPLLLTAVIFQQVWTVKIKKTRPRIVF